MDPISALSFTCNVLDLIQLAIKTSTAMKQIYDSPEGLRKKHESLLEESKALETVVDGLEDVRSQVSQAQSPLDARMQQIATDCISASAAIKKVLDRCKSKEKSLASAAKSAFQLFLHKSDIEDLQAELDQRSKTLTSLTATKTLVEIGKLRTQIHHASQRLETQTQDFKQQQSLVLEKLDILDDSLTSAAKSEPLLEQLRDILDASIEASDAMKVTKILENLRFPSMNDRFRTVRDSAPDTFNWIFDKPDVLLEKQPGLTISFPEWLRAGSGIFHIQGKPGSGKSTFMKFICEHHSRDQLLEEWAGGKTLICSQFFFWRIGSSEEKSLGGLIRGLLSGIIQHDPSLAKKLFSKNWDFDYGNRIMSIFRPLKLTDKEVSIAFDTIIHDQSLVDKYRLCFFIDGLDEFDESLGYTYHNLTQKLQQWSYGSAGQVKFCVSSRELPVFIKAFDKKQRITIQIFTKEDITSIVEQKLDGNEIFQRLRETEPKECDGIKREIIKNADGVFLWVVILLNQLEDALINEDSVVKLEEIVRSAPIELDAFFLHILNTIPHRYRQNAYILLAIAMRMTGTLLSGDRRDPQYVFYDEVISKDQQYLLAIQCSFLLETLDCASPSEIAKKIPPLIKMDDDTFNTRIMLTKTQVAAHCRGLLEYQENDKWDSVFKFTHRSIPEFLQRTLSNNLEVHGLHDQLIGELLVWITLVAFKIRLYLPVNDTQQIDETSENSSEEKSNDSDQSLNRKSRKESQERDRRERSKELGGQSDPLLEEKQWDNPFLRNDKLSDILWLPIGCLRQTPLQDANAIYQLLYLIDAELLQYRFQAASLDELPNKIRQTYGRPFQNDTVNENDITVFLAAGLIGLHEVWDMYLERPMNPLCNQLWYLLNVIISIIENIDNRDAKQPWLSFYRIIFETFFLAGVSVDSIVSLESNHNSTLWHVFLMTLFTHESSNSSIPTVAWELIETWLNYDADPSLAFWKHKGTSSSKLRELGVSYDESEELGVSDDELKELRVFQDEIKELGISKDEFKELRVFQDEIKELGISKDEVVVIWEARIKLINILMIIDDGGEVLSFNREGTWLGEILKENSNSLGDIFTLYDLVKAENPPNAEELLRLIDRNNRKREAQNNKPTAEPSVPGDQLRNSALTIPLRTRILFSALVVAGLAYSLAHFLSKSSPSQAQGETRQ